MSSTPEKDPKAKAVLADLNADADKKAQDGPKGKKGDSVLSEINEDQESK